MSLKNIKAIIFDIDGTLLNTHELIFQCYEHTIKEHNLKNLSRKQIAVIFGKPLEECYKILFPGEDVKNLFETHISFQEKNLHLSNPFPNVKESLKQLQAKGIKIGAASARTKRTTLKSLEINNIAKYFDIVISREDVQNPKPNPESINKILEYLGISHEFVVMVGDTKIDVLTGKNAKVKTIGVDYGFSGAPFRLAKPDFIIFDISEIISLIYN